MPLGPVELVVIQLPGNEVKGDIVPAIKELVEQGTIRVIDIPLEEDGQGGAHARFTLHEGQWVYFFLESASDHTIVPHQPTQGEYQDGFVATQRYWHSWLSQCRYRAAGGKWYSDQRSSSNC